MKQDHAYWHTLEYPKKPNPEEVLLFENYAYGKTLLLGETLALRSVCDEAIDLFPSGFAKKGDWFNLEENYDTIIGDGVINIVGLDLVDALRTKCKRLVIRVFNADIEKEYEWKYAKHFPSKFPGSTETILTQHGCTLVIWDF